jgi:15-cis-phytoene synthase
LPKPQLIAAELPMQDAYAHCEAVVRAADKDRFLAALFAPADLRRYLHALYAFNSEIARVREAAREPLPGEIRLQWWRDALAGEARGDFNANPVAAAILDTIAQCGLPREPLLRLIDAHGFDLYDEAMGTMADLDAYGRDTEGAVMTLGAQVLAAGAGFSAQAAASAGIACTVALRLRSLPFDVARRQMFLPMDLLERHGVSRAEVEARRNSRGLRAALGELRAHARTAFGRFRAAAGEIPDRCAPAFLAAAVVSPLLKRLDRAAADPFTPVEVPQWRRQWAIWRTARRWPAV